MAIQHANRGIVKKDLQLYYNREFVKSFRGEATTNLLTRTTTFDSGTWQGYCGSRTNVISNTIDTVDPFGKYNALKVVRNGVNTCYGAGAVAMGLLWSGPTVLVAGQTYTMSFYARGRSGGETLRFGLNDVHTSGYYITLTTSWVRYSITFTNITDTTRGFQFISDQASAGETYYIAAPQLEQKSYATPYCDITENINVRAVTTTNLLTSTYSSLPTNWSVDGSGQGTIGTYSYIENNSAIRVVDVNSNTRFRPTEVYLSGFSGSTIYTFSIKYRKVSGTPTLRFQIPWYNSSNALISYEFPTTSQINIYDIDGWQLAQYTLTSPANAAKVTFWVQDGDDYTTYNHTYDLKEPQIQTGKVPSAWTSNTATANTLTSGGGLLDISGNNVNVSLSNVAFDSGGYYFTSAGNSYLSTGITTLPSNTQLTIDVWTKPTSTTQAKTLVSKWGSSSQSNFCFLLFLNFFAQGNIYFLVGDSLGTSYSTHSIAHNLSTSVYSNFTIVYDNGVISWYRNGVFVSPSVTSANTVLKTVTTAITIGADFDGGNPDTLTRSYDGTIPNVRLYSRPLTAAEVLQNFNATRKTYGI
jgi:hypothetical protein